MGFINKDQLAAEKLIRSILEERDAIELYSQNNNIYQTPSTVIKVDKGNSVVRIIASDCLELTLYKERLVTLDSGIFKWRKGMSKSGYEVATLICRKVLTELKPWLKKSREEKLNADLRKYLEENR